MTIQIFDPVGEVEAIDRREERSLDTVKGKRVGYVFNQHISAVTFWKALEREVEQKLAPSAVQRLYKENTWAPASKAKLDELIAGTDYALVGVGA